MKMSTSESPIEKNWKKKVENSQLLAAKLKRTCGNAIFSAFAAVGKGREMENVPLPR